MFKNIINFFIRIFCVIANENAKKMKLIFVENIYGDRINNINCRSIWKDNKNRTYRVELLHKNKQ